MNNVMNECSKHEIRHNVHLLIDKKRDRYYILVMNSSRSGWKSDTTFDSAEFMLASSYEGMYTEVGEGLLLSKMFTEMSQVTEELDRVVPFYLSPKEVRVEGGWTDLSRDYDDSTKDNRNHKREVAAREARKKRQKEVDSIDNAATRLVRLISKENNK